MLDHDQGRWLTYAEAGELLAISADAARLRARRQGWSRRTPNKHGATARVFVPEEAFVHPSPVLSPGRPAVDRGTANPDATVLDQVDRRTDRVSGAERASLIARLDTRPTAADWDLWSRDLEARISR